MQIRILLMLLFIPLFACEPSKSLVEADLSALLSQQANTPVNIEVKEAKPGEGDASTVYLVVDFDISANQDVVFHEGLLKGAHVSQNERLKGGRVTMQYQKEHGQWRFQGHVTLDRHPQRP